MQSRRGLQMRPMHPGKDPDGIDDRRELTAGARLLRAITGDDRAGGI